MNVSFINTKFLNKYMNLFRGFKNIKRVEKFIEVCTKQGFGMFFDKISSDKHISSPEKHLKNVFEEMGGAFVKLGQLLSLRPDLIPQKYCTELEKLQENGEPINYDLLLAHVKKNIPYELNKIFKKIDHFPLAVGTIAQVHVAELINGKKVVLKVKKPFIEKEFEEDFELLNYLSIKLKNHLSEYVDLEMIVKEFEMYTRDELDFTTELKHLKLMKEKSQFYIPKVYDPLCTESILVMELLDGESLTKKRRSLRSNTQKKNLVEKLTDKMMKDVFISGYFHADPHPGNIFLMDKNIALVDFGIIGVLDDKTKAILTLFLYGVVDKNVDLMCAALTKLGVEGDLSSEEFKNELRENFKKYYDVGLDQIHFGTLLNRIFTIIRKFGIKIPRKIVLLGKSIMTLESVCQEIYPQFNFVKVAKPFLKKNISKIASVKLFAEQFKDEVLEYGQMFMSLPQDLKKLILLQTEELRSSKTVEETMKRMEVDFVYMQEEMFSFLFFIVFLILTVVVWGIKPLIFNISIWSFGFACMSLFSFLIFLFVAMKNLFK
jgi:ubiquinone biosynthesis protein